MQLSLPFSLRSIEDRLESWSGKHASLAQQAEEAATRRDMAVLLAYVRENKVVGTQSAGNMPLKDIREVAARITHPLRLEVEIGGRTYTPHSEEEVWPLHFLRILAEVGGLIKTGRARRWQITAQAARLIETQPQVQAAFLLAVWWYRVNWLVAYPYTGMGDHLPPHFAMTALDGLRAQPVGTYVTFSRYADPLISRTGLTWTAQESRSADQVLRTAVERMVITVLAGFGAVERRDRKKPLGSGTIMELEAIQVTPWGGALLEAVAIIGG